MKQKASRATPAGRAYLDLQKRARADGRNTDELLREYVFERFLYRVSLSRLRDQLVLKGGMLMAVLEARRATQDIDMLARGMRNDADAVVEAIAEVIGVDAGDDGVAFEPEHIQTRVIREGDVYSGIRAELPVGLASARLKLKLDINFGDPLTLGPDVQSFPMLLDWTTAFDLLCYPLELVLAEKIETMLRRGDANTRWRDFADVLLLTRKHDVVAERFESALRSTCTARKTSWMSVADAVSTLPGAGQRPWLTYRDTRRLEGLPASFEQVVSEVSDFADPIVSGDALSGNWSAEQRRWIL